METSKRRDCDYRIALFFHSPGWNGDLKKKGLRRMTISKFTGLPPDGMETSKRRDCDPAARPYSSLHKMEWRPQKEGIATHDRPHTNRGNHDGMETSKRRDCDLSSTNPALPETKWWIRWNGDLKKKGLRPGLFPYVLPIN
jgi:hypothetical protein